MLAPVTFRRNCRRILVTAVHSCKNAENRLTKDVRIGLKKSYCNRGAIILVANSSTNGG
jgi:hypothetical protein